VADACAGLWSCHQVNGGTVAAKVAFAKDLLEKDVNVDSVFSKDENVDLIGPTKVR
jgi:large subunit ribosomal protein L3e